MASLRMGYQMYFVLYCQHKFHMEAGLGIFFVFVNDGFSNYFNRYNFLINYIIIILLLL